MFAVGACELNGMGDFEVEADIVDGAVTGGDGFKEVTEDVIAGEETFGAVIGALGRGAKPGAAPGVLLRGAMAEPDCGRAVE